MKSSPTNTLNSLVAFLLLGLLMLLSSCSKESMAEEQSVPLQTKAEVMAEQELLDLMNEHRNSMGLSDMVFDATANEEAGIHTDYMIAQGDISHDHFEERASRIAAATQAKEITENVAKDFDSPQEALEHWLQSPGHRANIEGNFTHTGISIKKDAQGELYFTQIFFR